MHDLGQALEEVEERIATACRDAGRRREEVTLVAVSKTHPAETLRAAYDLGVRVFGESRLQEALPKVNALPTDIEWHFIGKLQSNKAKKAAANFDVLHTVESVHQLAEIEKAGRQVDCLIEVNVGQEPQKAGVLPQDLDSLLSRLLDCKNARYRGLMTIGPLSADPELSRPVFRELARLGARHGAAWLSMGMSADLHVAIQEGATHVRVGSAIFGSR